MTRQGERITVRRYRRVFHTDRRLYRVDRWAIPVPGGVPLLGMAYFGMTLLVVLILDGVPGFEQLLALLSPPLRYVILPAIVAVVGVQATPDGRSPHRFALDWARSRLRAPRWSAGRPVPEEGAPARWRRRMRVRRDADWPRLQRARVRGPATVTFNVPVRLRRNWRGRTVARGDDDGAVGPQEVRGHLEVRP